MDWDNGYGLSILPSNNDFTYLNFQILETNYLDSKIVFNKIKSFIYKINIFNNWTKIEIVLDNIQDTQYSF